MRSTLLTSLAPLAVLAVLVIALVKSPSKPSGENKNANSQATAIEFVPTRFLIRPYLVEANQVAVALNGGEIPVPGGQVPSIVVGPNVLRIVHLSWVHDWTDAGTRASFKTLQELYASKEAASLPALRIYLNPVFSDPNGEAVQRAMLQVFFRSDNRDLYQIIAKELGAGTLTADPEAIRARVETFEPLLMNDWNSSLGWLEADIEKTLSVAKAQQARNAKILNPAFKTQLVSMIDILRPSADVEELSAFVQQANAAQRTWLHSQPALSSEGK